LRWLIFSWGVCELRRKAEAELLAMYRGLRQAVQSSNTAITVRINDWVVTSMNSKAELTAAPHRFRRRLVPSNRHRYKCFRLILWTAWNWEGGSGQSSVAAFGVSYNSGGYQSRHDRRPIDSIKLTLSSAGWVRF
jgi:hypothetical protein